jgi:hypothetical protein
MNHPDTPVGTFTGGTQCQLILETYSGIHTIKQMIEIENVLLLGATFLHIHHAMCACSASELFQEDEKFSRSVATMCANMELLNLARFMCPNQALCHVRG